MQLQAPLLVSGDHVAAADLDERSLAPPLEHATSDDAAHLQWPCLAPLPAPTIEIPPLVSTKIRILSFVAILMVVYIHSFNEDPKVIEPDTHLKSELNFQVFVQFFLAGAALRWTVPFFFVVSGYLFFVHKQDDCDLGFHFVRRIESRVTSVLVPYVYWQLVAIFAILVLLLIPGLEANWPWFSYVKTWNLLDIVWNTLAKQPVAFQLWYLRDLFLMALLSPAFYYLFRYRLLLAVPLAFAYPWIRHQFLFSAWKIYILNLDSLVFFPIGAYFALAKVDLERKISTTAFACTAGVFLFMCVLKTALSFSDSTDAIALLVLYKLSFFPGIVTFWYSYDVVAAFYARDAERGDQSVAALESGSIQDSDEIAAERTCCRVPVSHVWRFLDWGSAYTLFLYCAHEPLMGCMIDNLIVLFDVTAIRLNFAGNLGKFLLFLLVPVVWVALLFGVALAMQKYIPAYYAILTGGRVSSPQAKKK